MKEVHDLIKRADALLDDGKFEDALKIYEQALLLNKKDPEIWNKMGVTLRSIGRYDEAVQCFNKSLTLDPRDNKAS